MSKVKNNSGLLAVIAVVVIAILGILVYQMNQKTPEEQIADDISNVVNDIGSSFKK